MCLTFVLRGALMGIHHRTRVSYQKCLSLSTHHWFLNNRSPRGKNWTSWFIYPKNMFLMCSSFLYLTIKLGTHLGCPTFQTGRPPQSVRSGPPGHCPFPSPRRRRRTALKSDDAGWTVPAYHHGRSRIVTPTKWLVGIENQTDISKVKWASELRDLVVAPCCRRTTAKMATAASPAIQIVMRSSKWNRTQKLPSGYLTVCHGKSPFLIGKPFISMGHRNTMANC